MKRKLARNAELQFRRVMAAIICSVSIVRYISAGFVCIRQILGLTAMLICRGSIPVIIGNRLYRSHKSVTGHFSGARNHRHHVPSLLH
jgi:hypothetical protein